jgi:hypothetical protein
MQLKRVSLTFVEEWIMSSPPINKIYRHAGITFYIEGREAPHFSADLSIVFIKKVDGFLT